MANHAPAENTRRWGQDHPWLTGLFTGLISGVLVSFYLTATGQATLTAFRHYFVTPSCSDPQYLLQVPDNEISADAYFVQQDTISNYKQYHSAGATVDGDLGTSWLQVWPSYTSYLGMRSSDYIEWDFSQRYDVRLICIVDGWTENDITYINTFPISAATLYVTANEIPPANGPPAPSGECAYSTPRFKDYLGKHGLISSTLQWQPVSFHCLTKDVVLHIDSASEAYRSKAPLAEVNGWQAPLTGISEIRFYYCPSWLCLLGNPARPVAPDRIGKP